MRIPQDAIPAAAFCFESHRGLPLGPMEIAAIQKHGFQDIDPELLARELKRLILDEPKGDSRDR